MIRNGNDYSVYSYRGGAGNSVPLPFNTLKRFGTFSRDNGGTNDMFCVANGVHGSHGAYGGNNIFVSGGILVIGER